MEPVLSQARILQFFRPLAFSWLLMAIESPVSVAIIARRPAPEIHTAAFLLMMSLALWIESPVIDLLATSTTLVRDHESYIALRKFVVGVIAFVTAVHFLIVFTPLYPLVTQKILSIPDDVADTARPGLKIMLFWSACIGWRRYLQGLMIRFSRTKSVGHGTIVRLVTLTVTGVVLHVATELDAITLTAIALSLAVFAEAAFAHGACRPILRTLDRGTGETNLTQKSLLRFHWPLTATTMLVLVANLVVSQALAQSPESKTAMASWQVAMTLVWLMRTVVYALPEAVIALYKDEASRAALKRFCLSTGLITSGIGLAVGLLGLDRLFFEHVLDVKPNLLDGAHLAFMLSTPLPLIGALQSYLRGMLTANHLTKSRLWAIVAGLCTLVGSLQLGVALQWSGVVTAAVAMSTSLAAELVVLSWAWTYRRQPTYHPSS